MKTRHFLFGLLLAGTAPLSAAPVTGWALIFDGDNDTSFTGVSATTASPVVGDAHKSSIAANFPTVTLANGQSLTLTGTVSFSGALVNTQFRWGLFDGDNPVTTGQGDEYAGFFSTAPSAAQSNNSIWSNDADAGLVHPFDTGNAGGPYSASPITAMSAPATTPAANTPLNFTLTVARNGSTLDISASITDGNTYTSTAGTTGVAPNINGFTFDSVAFLIGGSTSGSWNNVNATFSNIDVTPGGGVNPDTDGDGLPDAYEQTIIDADPNDAVNGLEDVMGTGAAPAVTDFDGDRANDAEEHANGTDPLDPDSDDDGLLDGVETDTGIFVDAGDTGTDPLDPDSDDDGFSDGYEVANGTDPNIPSGTIGERVLAVDFNRADSLGSPSQSLFRVVSGSAASQTSNAPSYTKTILGKQVVISQPGGAKFEFRGANGDSSRAIPGGDTSLSYLVSDFIATRTGAIDLTITGLAAGTYAFRSYHLDTLTGSGLGFAQGATTTTPNLIEAGIGGVVKASVQPTALGPNGLNTTFINDGQIPRISFIFHHDGTGPLTIELRATRSNGGDSHLLVNGFELLQAIP